MASIHPSRMALISQGQKSTSYYPPGRRSPSPARARRSPTPDRRDRSHGRRDRDRDERRDSTGRLNKEDRRDRERGRSRHESSRRSSPEYEDYRRPPPEVPRRQPQNMYPDRVKGRNGLSPQASGFYGGAGGSSDFLESRRIQREKQVADIWPPSPEAPARELSPKRGKSSKRSKRPRSLSSSDSSSDEDRRRRERRERKERKRSRKESKERRRHRSGSRRRSYSSDSEEDKKKYEKKRVDNDSRPTSTPPSPQTSELDEDDWVVKPTMAPPPVPVAMEVQTMSTRPTQRSGSHDENDDSEDDVVGPQPLPKTNTRKFNERNYGGALLRGEGSAMAAFLQEGTEARIPRRGEIGLTPEEIAQFEDVGYVMSGSRHRRMNAVRIRKENQVISAEEKRGILKLQKEERERREAILREEFGELVSERLKGVPEPRTTK